jgi:hypothetical protein
LGLRTDSLWGASHGKNPAKKKIGSPTGLAAFNSLANRLVHVSKIELDAEERKYLAMRKRLKDKRARKGTSGR